ncbi:hypothetical protein M441DRAFT_203185 [Trichoderma asperellum CBS 433.97]|uniref:Uncharacterized protein n=1 Tax=Trichoderma asperellum (strain ATCC 204424 / CBS 433.97 / NBRC 101777) TaxID=1042311 RepID=A0A2T3YU65_TRIA4|nr:hypothetical protein M441DRAFT_203185 [Trichoderma asperellum CBS 433.97]PTB36098.1 hypothetical protein M441DRAFT_203185 [Trichoderma asperellum CBS 433.97]
MPITRSATRASKINTEKTTTKHTSKQQKNPRSIINNTIKANGEDPFPVEDPRRLVEWISLKDPPNSIIPNSDGLFATLQEIHKLNECIVIARGRPRELRGIEWLIIGKQHLPIDWRSSRDREKFLLSELFLRLNEALSQRSWSQEFAWSRIGGIIRANPIFPPQKLYEVLTIYFPADLDQEAILSIEGLRIFPYWQFDDDEEEDLAKYPCAALKSQIPLWIKGTCEYQGQTARRLALFIVFTDEEGERLFKEKVKYNRRGRPPWDVMMNFFDELKDLGMIGYESLHVEFMEVVHYAPENYVPEPPRSISPETRKRFNDLRAQEAYDSDMSL